MIENARHRHLNDTWEWIKANPTLHDQRNWAVMTHCGTVACVAGWGVLRAGGHINYRRDYAGDMFASSVDASSLPSDVVDEMRKARFIGDTVEVFTAARFLFGLDTDVANALFDGDNDRDDLEQMVTAVVTGAPFPFELSSAPDTDDMGNYYDDEDDAPWEWTGSDHD